MNWVNYMLACQPVGNYGLKRFGVRGLEEYFNGLSANISHQVVLYCVIKVKQMKSKWQYPSIFKDNWIKLIHV